MRRQKNESYNLARSAKSLLCILSMAAAALWGPQAFAQISPAPAKVRAVVLTDIGPKPDPDDTQSLVRLLLYSNDIDIEGLVASTAAMRDYGTHEDFVYHVVDAYAKVRTQLAEHDPNYPLPEELRAVVKRGNPKSGLRAVGDNQDSEGSDWLIARAEAADPRPLWVLAWGGTNVLAQALYKVSRARSPEELTQFVSKLRVFAISDQDDTGPWLRENFPGLFLIVSPGGYTEHPSALAVLMSVLTHGKRYGKSTTSGFGKAQDGANNDIVSNAWLLKNIIKDHGPLGALYPKSRFGMEGDTPSFLYLVRNGLNVPERPDWGGWGGRWEKKTTFYTDTADTVAGVNGKEIRSNQATVWRWRAAFQNDFAARMDWTVQPRSSANHAPVPTRTLPDEITVEIGAAFTLSAADSSDPDSDGLDFRWFDYPEAAGCRDRLIIDDPLSPSTRVRIPPGFDCAQTHIVLQVVDRGAPPLTRYRRVRIIIAED